MCLLHVPTLIGWHAENLDLSLITSFWLTFWPSASNLGFKVSFGSLWWSPFFAFYLCFIIFPKQVKMKITFFPCVYLCVHMCVVVNMDVDVCCNFHLGHKEESKKIIFFWINHAVFHFLLIYFHYFWISTFFLLKGKEKITAPLRKIVHNRNTSYHNKKMPTNFDCRIWDWAQASITICRIHWEKKNLPKFCSIYFVLVATTYTHLPQKYSLGKWNSETNYSQFNIFRYFLFADACSPSVMTRACLFVIMLHKSENWLPEILFLGLSDRTFFDCWSVL